MVWPTEGMTALAHGLVSVANTCHPCRDKKSPHQSDLCSGKLHMRARCPNCFYEFSLDIHAVGWHRVVLAKLFHLIVDSLQQCFVFWVRK